ncbi:MAG TPA: hypothetical protein VFF09_04645 [archaeon]|nr:hypothetical protein [archaeon]
MRLIFKAIIGMGIIIAAIILAVYLYWFFNWLVFSYNFLIAVD